MAWGAAVDIREALSTRKILSQIDDMDATIGQMEDFNNTLRSQRHDFLNHLQVVYSLIEMQEYEEANAYIDKVYGAITSVSRVIKTANPAINALLTVKSAACEKAGVKATVSIQSSWKHLPMQGWEMCKVLSNLIDNAIDALREIDGERRLDITLTEDVDEGARNASVIYTDIWVSMGEPDSLWAERIKLLKPYQVSADVMAKAAPDAIFMHCLPSFHDRHTTIGEDIYEKFGLAEMEVTNDVFEGPRSRVFDEAENRMHTIKAVMYATLK